MARKSKTLEENKQTILEVMHQLDDKCDFNQLMFALEFPEVSRSDWLRWRRGDNIMSEARAIKMLGHAIKNQLLDDNLKHDAILLQGLLEPRIQDIIDDKRRRKEKEIKAVGIIKDAWRQLLLAGNNKSTLIADLDKIVSANQNWLARQADGDENILVDAIDHLLYLDSKGEMDEVMNEKNAEDAKASLTRYEVLKRRAAAGKSKI